MKKTNKKILATSFLFCAVISSTAAIVTITSNNNIKKSNKKLSLVKTTTNTTTNNNVVYPEPGQVGDVTINGTTQRVYTTKDADFDITGGELTGFATTFNPEANAKINLVLPAATKTILEQAFSPSNPSNTTTTQFVSNIARIDLSLATGLTSITQNVFLQLPVLTEVKFNNTLTDLGAGNFNMCPELTTLVDFDKTKITEMSKAKGFSQTSVNNITLPSTLLTLNLDALPTGKNSDLVTSTDFTKANSLTSVTSGGNSMSVNQAFYFPDNFDFTVLTPSVFSLYTNYNYINLPIKEATLTNFTNWEIYDYSDWQPITQAAIDKKIQIKVTFDSTKLKTDYPGKQPQELITIFNGLTRFEKTKYITIKDTLNNKPINPMAALRDFSLNETATDIVVTQPGYSFVLSNSTFNTTIAEDTTTKIHELTNWNVTKNQIQKLEEFLRTDIDKWNKISPKDNNFTFGSILSNLKLTSSNILEAAKLELKSFAPDTTDANKYTFEIMLSNTYFEDGTNSKTIKFGLTLKAEDSTKPTLSTSKNPAIDNWNMTPEQLESFKTELNNNVAEWNKKPTADFNIGNVLSQLGLSSSNLAATSKLTVSEFTVDPNNPNLNKFTITLDDGTGNTTSIQYQILLNQKNNNNPNSSNSLKLTEPQFIGIVSGILLLLLIIILVIGISRRRSSKNK